MKYMLLTGLLLGSLTVQAQVSGTVTVSYTHLRAHET